MKTIAYLRRGQLITTFGIGSILDAPDYSVMIAGQSFWKDKLMEDIYEPRLQKKLNVSVFKQPIQVDEYSNRNKTQSNDDDLASVPVVRFPLWHFCPNCKKLAHIRQFGYTKEKYCKKCSTKNDPQKLIPSRFILACKNGHVDDFPWEWWIKGAGCNCPTPKLTISNTGKSSALSSIVIKCERCKVERTLDGIFNKKNLAGVKCWGNRPWLGDRVECTDEVKPIVVIRGSTTTYYPFIESAISIPPYSQIAFKIIERIYYTALKNIDDPLTIDSVIKGVSKGKNISFEILKQAYNHIKNIDDNNESQDIKNDEYIALCNPDHYDPKNDFAAKAGEIPSDFSDYFKKIVLINRLRVVSVLTNFSRVIPDSNRGYLLNQYSTDWLPGMEVHGEGLFIEFDKDKIGIWKEKFKKQLSPRVLVLENRRRDLLSKGIKTYSELITEEFLLIHTFSHLLMRVLVNDCGYSSSALKERIYSSTDTDSSQGMNGVLIYTASSDSEGSFGGLVRQANPLRLRNLLIQLIEQAKWCSNDPLCFESEGQGMDSLNLSACHSCSLLPETACEYFNGFLDRAMLVGSERDVINYGFFNQFD